MSIRFSLRAASDLTEDVRIDAHHIPSDGTWFEHPIRSHNLRPGHDLCLLAHVALGFVIRKGGHEELAIQIEHDEPTSTHGLEIVEGVAPAEHPDVAPSVVAPHEARRDIEPAEQVVAVVAPGCALLIRLGRRVNYLRIREVSMREAAGDA